LAGELADGVGPHPIGNQEDMAALPPTLGVRSPDHRETVLIIRTTHPRVGRGCVDNDVFPVHSPILLSLCNDAVSKRLHNLVHQGPHNSSPWRQDRLKSPPRLPPDPSGPWLD